MAPQQGGGNADDSMNILWAIGSIFVIVYLIWHFFEEQLRSFAYNLRLAEAKFISIFMHTNSVTELLGRLTAMDPSDLNQESFQWMSAAVGEYLRWPIMLLIGLMALIIYRSNMSMRFTRTHNMQTLLEQEQLNWPQVALMVKLDLVSLDVNQGPWAMAMTPLQFAKKNKLLKVELIPDGKAAWRAQGLYKATVEKEKAMQIFAMQLGPLFVHPMRMPKHIQALFAVFAARSTHDVDGARAMLDRLALSAARGKMDYSGVAKTIAKYIKDKAVVRCMQRHAYVMTVMASMLELARTDGVLASSDFLWLKPIDRRLWYMLNCVGRQVVFSEAAGAFAHWKAEKEMQRPLSVPVVDMATKALEDAMEKIIYVPDEDEVVPQNG